MSTVVFAKGVLDIHRGDPCNAARRGSPIVLVLLCVVRATAALANDHPLATDHAFAHEAQLFPHGEVGAAPNFSAPNFSAPNFSAPLASQKLLSEPQNFSTTEFRARKPRVLDFETGRGRGTLLDAPMVNSTSIWQQLGEFKSQNRLRLLTLWQTRGSTLSLQAGKHGAPSLQWSTPWVHREGASRGLFDRLLPQPQPAYSGTARTSMPHAAMSSTSARPLDSAPAGNSK